MSKLKFLKASYFYSDYLRHYYAAHPGEGDLSYQEQLNRLMADRFAWSDVWKRTLEGTGDFEVCEIVTNAAPLQKAWAKENGISFSENNWAREILAAQILAFKPDVFFADDYTTANAAFRKEIREACKSIRSIIGWDSIVHKDAALYAGCDWMLSCLPDLARYYNQVSGMKGYFFRTGFDDSVWSMVNHSGRRYPFSFVGSLSLFKHGHGQRLRTLGELNRKISMDLWLSGDVNFRPLSRARLSLLAEFRFRDYMDLALLARKGRGSVFGLSMYQVLADSSTTFNAHIDAAGGVAANMRLYEATGMGTCLVTDWKDNLKDLFVPDEEVVTYRSVDECIEKVTYLLMHPEEAEKIAAAGRKRTLQSHKQSDRILEFIPELRRTL